MTLLACRGVAKTWEQRDTNRVESLLCFSVCNKQRLGRVHESISSDLFKKRSTITYCRAIIHIALYSRATGMSSHQMFDKPSINPSKGYIGWYLLLLHIVLKPLPILYDLLLLPIVLL